jgi:hypothetical protein
MPAVHAIPPPQRMPHPPQLFESVCSLTHAPPHSVWPAVQFAMHVPAEHTRPAPHAMPHAPQLFGSLCVSTQTLLHSVLPPVHAHAPAMHA